MKTNTKFPSAVALLSGSMTDSEADTLASYLGSDRSGYFAGAARRLALSVERRRWTFHGPVPAAQPWSWPDFSSHPAIGSRFD